MRSWIGLLIILSLLGVAVVVRADAAYMPISERVAQSALVARVRVVSTRDSASGGKHTKVATARVVQLAKGSEKRPNIEIEFDTDPSSPGVQYKKDEDCLIFLRKEARGRYSTVSTYFGKYLIDGDNVAGWPTDSGERDAVPLPDVLDQIKQAASGTTDARNP